VRREVVWREEWSVSAVSEDTASSEGRQRGRVKESAAEVLTRNPLRSSHSSFSVGLHGEQRAVRWRERNTSTASEIVRTNDVACLVSPKKPLIPGQSSTTAGLFALGTTRAKSAQESNRRRPAAVRCCFGRPALARWSPAVSLPLPYTLSLLAP
jgi:hypothetical protein